MAVVDFEKARKKRARKRTAKRFTIMLAICGFILVLFSLKSIFANVPIWGMIKSNITIGGQQANFPIKLPENKYYGLETIKKNILVKSESKMMVYDTSGKELLNASHGLDNPIYKVVGDNILYYATNTKFVTVQSLYGSSKRIEVENNVFDAALAKDGKVAIAGHSSSNSSVVEVYNTTSEDWIFRWHDPDYLVTKVLFTPDLNGVIIVTLNTREGQLYSKIQQYNLKDKLPVFEIEFPDQLLVSVEYHGNNNIIAIGDKKCISFDTKGKILGEYDYKNKPLEDYDNTGQNGAVLLLADYGANEDGSLITLDKQCNVLMAVSSSKKIVSINVTKNTEYILTDSELQWYNEKGSLMGTMPAPPNCLFFNIIDNYGYFFTVDKLEKIEIKAVKDSDKNKKSSTQEEEISESSPDESDTVSQNEKDEPSSQDSKDISEQTSQTSETD